MNRVLLLTIALLVAIQGYTLWQLDALRLRSFEYDSAIRTTSASLKKQEVAAREQLDKLRASLDALGKQPPPPGNDLEPLIGQFVLAQSLRVDYLVDWIDIIEKRLYFLIFPPQSPQEREQTAAELQARTDRTKEDFISVSERSRQIRDLLIRRLETRPPAPQQQGQLQLPPGVRPAP